MNQVIPFNFENHAVRTVVLDETPWWVGKDVCLVLAYTNPNKAIGDHCKGVTKRYPLETEGGIQKVRIISEGDVFRLIVNSHLPQARRFEKWLFEEALPQIRKTGAYVPEDVQQNLKELQARVLELEINRSVTEKLLLHDRRTIRRYEEQRLMTYADKREILALYINKYRISDIQRITKKSRGAIRRFLDWFFSLDHEAFEAELKKITHEDFWNDEFFEAMIAAARDKGGAA
jgi:prophage antirepressor-like protein